MTIEKAVAGKYFDQMAKKIAAEIGPGLAATGMNGITLGQQTEFGAAAQHAAATFGLITKSGSIADIKLAESKDARAKMWLDLGKSGLDVFEVPGGKLVGFAVDQVKDQVFGSLEQDTAEGARSNANKADEVTKTLLYDMAAAALARHGVFGAAGPTPASTNPAASFPVTDPRYFLTSAGCIIGWRDMKPPQRRAYAAWLDSGQSGFSTIRGILDGAYNNMRQD